MDTWIPIYPFVELPTQSSMIAFGHGVPYQHPQFAHAARVRVLKLPPSLPLM